MAYRAQPVRRSRLAILVPRRTTNHAQGRFGDLSARPVGCDLVAANMTEKDLKSIVLNIARRYGWLVHHDLPAMNIRGRWATHVEGDVGFPDLLLVHPNRGQMLVVELKADRGKTTTSQDNWLAAFGLAGIENHVVRPSDLEFITDRLSRPDRYN